MQNDFSSICSRFEYDCTSHGKSVGNFSCPFFPWLMQHGWRRELFFLFSRHGRLIKNTISKGFNLLLLPSFFSSLCKICISIKILCETTHIYYVKDKYFGIFLFLLYFFFKAIRIAKNSINSKNYQFVFLKILYEASYKFYNYYLKVCAWIR